MGTAVFALSGTVTAGQAGMDLLGENLNRILKKKMQSTAGDLFSPNLNRMFYIGRRRISSICLVHATGT